jgi:hypothetical protein
MLARRAIALLLVAAGFLVLTCGGARAQSAPHLDLANARHVRALYLDLLGRTPDQDELAMAQASTPAVLASHLVGSRDFWEHWYEDELYYFLLIDAARPADAPAGEEPPARLAAGRLTMPDAVREIVTGQAFNRANPGNDTFASVVLEQLLGVNVQEKTPLLAAGRRMYDGAHAQLFGEDGSSQADLVAIVTRQPAFLERIVDRQYRRVVGREPAPADVQAGARALRERPADFPELVKGWVLAPAYAARLGSLRPKTDLQFIRGLFVDLLDRKPSAEELQRLRGALSVMADAAPLRSVIARALLGEHADSLPARGQVDGPAFVTDSFHHYLGRDPSAQERNDFVAVLADPACTPATVVQAIVTHWEYQYY